MTKYLLFKFYIIKELKSMIRKMKKYNYEVISPLSDNNIIFDEIFDGFIICLIILNTIAVILESFNNFYN